MNAPAQHDNGWFGPELKMEDYYRKLRWRLYAGISVAFLVPVVVLSLYFHFQFNVTLKESGKQHLRTLAESQRNTIDLFLQERIVNIFNLFHEKNFKLPPSSEDMGRYLQTLLEMNDAFVDVGFLDESGVQLGYVGPYVSLRGKDYSKEPWFQTLMNRGRNYYISGIYLGFRHKPHFTIAVKQIFDERPCVMRATIDPDKCYLFLRTIGKEEGVDSALIDREGYYQIVDPDRGNVLQLSPFKLTEFSGSGAYEIRENGSSELFAYAWLEEVPWALVARQPLRIAYADMYQARRMMITMTATLTVVIIAAMFLTTKRLLQRAQATDEARKQLKGQLFHAAKLVAAGELAAGVAHEINNPLAIISSESGVIRDMLDPQFHIEHTPESINKELDYIDEAVFRARDITQKLLTFVRKSDPHLVSCDLNDIVEEVVGGLKEKEFFVSDIKLIREYDPSLPKVMIDPDQIRQVLLNIVNNAGDAIEGPGSITLSTGCRDGFVRLTITDTGRGMTSDVIEKIFDPFYTTKDVGKGTGLGLSISLNIVQSMGGRIDVQSIPGAGSSFNILLPLKVSEEKQDAEH